MRWLTQSEVHSACHQMRRSLLFCLLSTQVPSSGWQALIFPWGVPWHHWWVLWFKWDCPSLSIPILSSRVTTWSRPLWLLQGWAYKPCWSKQNDHLNFCWHHWKSGVSNVSGCLMRGELPLNEVNTRKTEPRDRDKHCLMIFSDPPWSSHSWSHCS